MSPQQVRRYGTRTVGLLAAQIALILFLIFALFHRIGFSYRFEEGITVPYGQVHAADQAVRVASDVLTLVFLITVVMWCRWQYGAQQTADQLTTEPLRFTAGWAVGWWFIPFANLVMPFQTLREVWKASHGGDSWEAIPTWVVISLWWLSWVMLFALNTFDTYLGAHLRSSNGGLMTPAGLASHDSWWIGTLLVQGVAAALAILMVRSVIALQQDTISSLTPGVPDDGEEILPAPPAPPMPSV